MVVYVGIVWCIVKINNWLRKDVHFNGLLKVSCPIMFIPIWHLISWLLCTLSLVVLYPVQLCSPSLFIHVAFDSYNSFLEWWIIFLRISVSASMLKWCPQIIQFVMETSRFSSAGTFQSVGLKAGFPSSMVVNMPVGLVLSMVSSRVVKGEENVLLQSLSD